MPNCVKIKDISITVFTVAMWTVCVVSILTLWNSYTLKSGLSFTIERWQYFTQLSYETL